MPGTRLKEDFLDLDKGEIRGLWPERTTAGKSAGAMLCSGRFLGWYEEIDPTFVRKSLSKLSKAGLVVTTRGKNGASTLTRSPEQITLLDIYRASEAPPTFAIHNYPVEKRCPISSNIKGCMSSVLRKAQNSFENSLDRINLADVVGEIRRARH